MKSNSVKIDKKDEKILQMLKDDCKIQVKRISDETKSPITTIYSKIKKLEKSGVIKGYKAVLDDKKMGLGAMAFIFVTATSDLNEADTNPHEIAKNIAKIPQVEDVYVLTGTWDILVKVKGKNIDDIGEIVLNHIRKVKGVQRTLTAVCLESVKIS